MPMPCVRKHLVKSGIKSPSRWSDGHVREGSVNDEHVAGKIRTVLGPITPEQLGICMVHEHLIVDAWKMWPVPNYSLIIDDVGLVTEEVQAYRTAGGTSIVDVTNIGLGRDPQALQRISEATGVQIVMGCGWYRTGLPGLHPGKKCQRTGGDAGFRD